MLYGESSGVAIRGLIACVLHEMGHYAALIITKNDVKRISITVFGAKIVPERMMSFREEIFVAAAGPGINLVLAYLWAGILGDMMFAGVNLALAVFNLLPTGELDGAKILRGMLAGVVPYELSYDITRCLGNGFTAIMAVCGGLYAVRNRNLTLMLMTLWLSVRPVQKKRDRFDEKEWKKGLSYGTKTFKIMGTLLLCLLEESL